MLNISVGTSSGPQLRWAAQSAGFQLAEGAAKTELGPMTGRKLHVDFSSTVTGWMKVAAGVAPVSVWNADLTTHTNNPAPNEVSADGKAAFKQALAVQAMLDDGRVVSIETNAAGFLGVLIDAYTAASGAGAIGAGIMATFECTGITMRKFGPAAVAVPGLKFVTASEAPAAIVQARDAFKAGHSPLSYTPAMQVAAPAATSLQPMGGAPLASPVAVAPAPAIPPWAATAAAPAAAPAVMPAPAAVPHDIASPF
jgi:hypothetical protein